MEWLSLLGGLGSIGGSLLSGSQAQSAANAQMQQAYMNYALQMRAMDEQRQMQQQAMGLARDQLNDNRSNTAWMRQQALDAIQRELDNTAYGRRISEDNTRYNRQQYQDNTTYNRSRYADETAYNRRIQQEMTDYAKAEQAKQDALATATRIDSAGNKTYYDKATNTWVDEPTAATKGIINAQQLAARENAINGQIRREQGQQANAESRRNSGNLADAYLRLLLNNAGGPTREGVAGKNTVARATAVGENVGALRDAVARNMIRSGNESSEVALNNLRATSGASGGQLRTALATGEASDASDFQRQKDAFTASLINQWGPMQQARSNLTDAPVPLPQVTSPDTGMSALMGRGVGAVVGNRAAAGAYANSPYAQSSDPFVGRNDAFASGAAGINGSMSGENAAVNAYINASKPLDFSGLNYASGNIGRINQPVMPWGSAFGALTDTIGNFIKSRNSGGSNWGGSMGDYLNNRNRDPSYGGGGGF